MVDAKKIILDCDPGRDDAVALMLAHADPRVELVGVSIVGGNLSLESCTNNALDVLKLLESPVKVFPGCDRPLQRPLECAENFHANGIEGLTHDPTLTAESSHGVDFIIDTVLHADPGTITLVATGPLTNLATAVQRSPEIVSRVAEVVLMGGAYNTGNCTPVAEFNIHTDPEAADVVFSQSWPVTMIGLDVTHRALVTTATQSAIAAIPTATATVADQILQAYRQAYKQWSDFDDPPLHDVCAVAYVADPTLFTTAQAPVRIELAGTYTAGMTVVDFRAFPQWPERHTVATGCDATRLFTTLQEALARCP
ncbi:nucleoside hydrolase [Corynebacterium choanae]|uniref:Pyrimidine-specific ribonucleoside hydrolase RihB n=1 Tax=Corynebacterium choanae TaxID=1862358 RepID=A0A3G6JBF9_9CORY|nr:nucleoside hydrolase [Corynebacterium choanae]AZA14000.1 Pyrimidine-specific ribonucleoside hydrolase RihB [Corynebacterium choanae]